MITRPLLVMAVMLTTGCLKSTDAGDSSISLAGTWQYSAVQSGASGGILSGTLTIVQQSGASFQGSLAATFTSVATGEPQVLTGTVSGSAPTNGTIDFDAFLEPVARRHVGELLGNTLSGTWVRLSPGGVSASGTFSARRSQ